MEPQLTQETPAPPEPDPAPREPQALLPLTLPNKLTLLRLALCVPYFALILWAGRLEGPPGDARGWDPARLYDAAFLLFVIASVTDILDGYIARRRAQGTSFGRAADPAVDKILIVGSFVLFPREAVPPAMTLLILAREILVQGLRGYLESLGIAFGANWWGKRKMLLQSLAVGAVLLYLGHAQGGSGARPARILLPYLHLFLWFVVVATAISGAQYLLRGYAALRRAPRP